MRPIRVSGWWTGGGSLPEERASRARRRAWSSEAVREALAVEPAEKIGGGTLALERIAFEAGGNQVAIGIAPRPDARHDVVEALDARVGAAQTIKTMAAFAEVDGVAQGAGLEEVECFEVGGLRLAGGAAEGDRTGAKAANLIGQTHVNNVAGFAATDEAEGTEDD